MKKPKLIYIAGNGRSGSTLLTALLSEAEGCFGVGEPVMLWRPNPAELGGCACGKSLSDCEVWSSVLPKHLEAMNVRRQDILWSDYQTLLILLGWKGFINQEYLETLKNLYTAIYETSGAQVIVDESKFLPYLYALNQTGMFDLYVIHLLRDPRAVAFSWQRLKKRGTEYMPRIPWFTSARRWLSQHFFSFISRCFVPKEKYIKIKYEDFVEEPELLLNDIFTKTGVKAPSLFISSHQFNITHESHLVRSNPSIPRQGVNTIHKDLEWRKNMPFWAKIWVTLICWPMMLVYKYPLWPQHNSVS